MRTLKYAILGLLMQTPVTGYDIAKAFGPGLGSFWSAKHSQIYPELKRLTVEGLIQYSVVMQGERMEKKLYEITAGCTFFDPPVYLTACQICRKMQAYPSQRWGFFCTQRETRSQSGWRKSFMRLRRWERRILCSGSYRTRLWNPHRWRGIATRYAKTSDAFIAAVHVRCIAIWAAIRA